MMPTIALLVFPVIALVLFARLGVVRGLIWTTLLGYLFLPEGYIVFRLPASPDYDKYMAVSLSLILGVVMFGQKHRDAPAPRRSGAIFGIMVALAGLLVIGTFFTMLDNQGNLIDGFRVRRGLDITYVTSTVGAALVAFTPFILALKFLDRPEMHRSLVAALALSGAAYGLLVLFEWRMSPQLHSMIYGYFPHSWRQHLRGDGFRAVVFLDHGLSVGLFMVFALIAALARAFAVPGERVLYLSIAGWCTIALILSRNVGAVSIGVMLAGALFFMGRRGAAMVAAGFAGIFAFLPALRQAGALPLDTLVSFFSAFDPARAASLAFRIDQEERLIARASQKPLFGWGGWGRSRDVGEDGTAASVLDGGWIIQLGETGWIGYIAYFGLLALPLVILPFVWRHRHADRTTVALALIGAGNLIYLIPNSTLSPVSFLVFGAIAGLVLHTYPETQDEAVPSGDRTARRPDRYTRFPAAGEAPAAHAPATPSGAQGRRAPSLMRRE